MWRGGNAGHSIALAVQLMRSSGVFNVLAESKRKHVWEHEIGHKRGVWFSRDEDTAPYFNGPQCAV
jgi:hypothetical protein